MEQKNDTGGPEPYGAEDFDRYLRRLGHGEETRKMEREEVLRFTRWLAGENIPLLDAGHNDVTAYINFRKRAGNKPNTLSMKIIFIKHYYEFLRAKGEVADRSGAEHGTQWNNPASNIEIKGIKRSVLYHTYTPEELEHIYRTFRATLPQEAGQTARLSHSRDCCIVKLCIKQGMAPEETGRLTVGDILPSEGKIKIPGTRKSNPRELPLEAAQLHELTEYMYNIRPKLLALSGKVSQALFINAGKGTAYHNIAHAIITKLKEQNPGFTDMRQIRASVISNWLKVHNIRKVQYMAGHRYISATERYKANNMEELINDVERFHPLG